MIAQPAADRGGHASGPDNHRLSQAVVLIYELLDAHDDTRRLAVELAGESAWQPHLEYLRALQRTGREILAHIASESGDRWAGGSNLIGRATGPRRTGGMRNSPRR
jgi:hypothetical protein